MDDELRCDDHWLRYYDEDQPLTEAVRCTRWRLHIGRDTIGFTPLLVYSLGVIANGTITHLVIEDALGRELHRSESPGRPKAKRGQKAVLPNPTIILADEVLSTPSGA